jgi:homoserine O-acetyltransferase
MQENTFIYQSPFSLESGVVLPQLQLTYCTIGKLNPVKNNVIWIFHALTANARVDEWWPGMTGENCVFSPKEHFIVCVNKPGSCYGSTGAASLNPETGKPYGTTFPLLTIRDMVKAYQLLKNKWGIKEIQVAIGSSMGGMQAMEWAISEPELFRNLILIATNAVHSAWGIAFNSTQRMAIEAGEKGLEAARAIAMLSYRNYELYKVSQTDPDEKLEHFKADSYQRYQGKKLKDRFDVNSYVTLSKAMDSHNVGRSRGGWQNALAKIQAKTLITGIESDILFPIEEQLLLYSFIPNASFKLINSLYGHDGFMTEHDQLNAIIQNFLFPKNIPYKTRPASI